MTIKAALAGTVASELEPSITPNSGDSEDFLWGV